MVEELSLGLAPIVVTELYEALRALCQHGVAVLVTEQFQRFEEKYSDRWVVLERGTVLARGESEGTIGRPADPPSRHL